jgi:DNA-binding transcriptional LysR family regulator
MSEINFDIVLMRRAAVREPAAELVVSASVPATSQPLPNLVGRKRRDNPVELGRVLVFSGGLSHGLVNGGAKIDYRRRARRSDRRNNRFRRLIECLLQSRNSHLLIDEIVPEGRPQPGHVSAAL